MGNTTNVPYREGSPEQDTVEQQVVELLPQLRRFARRLAGEGGEAADLVQETCRRAIEARAQFAEGTNAFAWLCRILRNAFHDRRRRSRREVALGDLAVEAPASEAVALWRLVSDEDFRLALAALPDPYRTMYQRHALEGRPYQQIARELGIPPATVGVRLLRARRRVRAFLTQRLVEVAAHHNVRVEAKSVRRAPGRSPRRRRRARAA